MLALNKHSSLLYWSLSDEEKDMVTKYFLLSLTYTLTNKLECCYSNICLIFEADDKIPQLELAFAWSAKIRTNTLAYLSGALKLKLFDNKNSANNLKMFLISESIVFPASLSILV